MDDQRYGSNRRAMDSYPMIYFRSFDWLQDTCACFLTCFTSSVVCSQNLAIRNMEQAHGLISFALVCFMQRTHTGAWCFESDMESRQPTETLIQSRFKHSTERSCDEASKHASPFPSAIQIFLWEGLLPWGSTCDFGNRPSNVHSSREQSDLFMNPHLYYLVNVYT